MATPPRGKANQGSKNSRTTSRTASKAKKPAVIDLAASEVKDTSPAAKPAAAKTVPTTSKPASAANDKPVSSSDKNAKPSTPSPSMATSKSSGSPKNQTHDKPKVSKPATPKPANNSSGFGKLLAAGIVGGLITLGGAGAMQYSGLLPNLGQTPTAAPVVDLNPLQEKIAALQNRLDTVETSSTPKSSAVDLTPLENRIAKLESKPALPALSGNPDTTNSAEVEQLREAIEKFSTANTALATRLAALENTPAPQTDNSAISDAIGSAIAPLTSANKQTGEKLRQIETSVAALNKKINEDVDTRINAFSEKLKNAATGEKLAKSVAINALKSAMENGQSYSAALTSLETLAGSSKPLEKLKPFAVNGIATNAQLLEEFNELQSSILRAATNDPDAGLTDRLMSSIQSLVTISSSEALPGGSPEAVISRIDANLKSENFGAAISEWKTLPDPAQQISKTWVSRLEQRMDADRQMFKLMKNLQSGN